MGTHVTDSLRAALPLLFLRSSLASASHHRLLHLLSPCRPDILSGKLLTVLFYLCFSYRP